ncbi:MAG: prepilin-type N-terminal cleavage/methylation domain-containing protein [Kiritimatiellae bacterium]|jgi:prepilin-type N-terminal cleavage/methylation domain-containing protein|nr:prepilin-type N-terminal cleavage/methylation domain-containing protein [Kiritimatiellia bacterium]
MSAIKKRVYGFSLLELLAVMSIMGLLTTLAVTSYFSAARGMARRGAVKHLVNSLVLARQRACMDNARVSVFIYNEFKGIIVKDSGGTEESVVPSYVVCKETGKITMVQGSYLVDEFNALDKTYETFEKNKHSASYKGGFRLYNLSVGGFSFVYPWVVNVAKNVLTARDSPYKSRIEQNINAWAFEISRDAINWNVGDSYGIESAPSQTLPRGYQIDNIGDDKNDFMVVTFLSDGRALKAETITLEETRMPLKKTKIKVTTQGLITYDGEWL